ncbi:lysophospholipid acyltransferase family protein [Desulfitobacterium metallireducens]|uniref:1-acyl-sn-glycerol-3-phosphate acyltransferase n=1 Tax=Desulfitobacterium metallireducens DSM 15288 TaxID=871968 RepID=W0EDA2_9FIRM|nr:lysophospholipid acyltransferase family protein [Desulfitobacterium metallireducens]AHF07061.1 1-acyl-sn-glycerol-3-phosphate acyltransferase [Desulfitobacterium metallireducens DSM 15288]
MFRTILWFIYFGAYLLAIYPKMLKVQRLAEIGNTVEHDELTHQVAQKWARSLVKFAGVTVTVTGQVKVPTEGAVLFVSNHQGNFDIPLLLGYIEKPKGFIAKIELKKVPLIRTWMTHLNCVFMDRSDIRQSLKVMKQAADYLKAGYSMVIFPEGTRSKSDTIGEFKAGSLKLALKAGIPIIPITISGSYKIMEQNGTIIKPADVKITLHDLIPTAGLSKEEAIELPEKIRSIIEQSV